MRIRSWLLPVAFALILPGCTSIQCGANKGQFLEQFERFMSEAEVASESFTDSPWKLLDEQLEVYVLDCYDNFKNEMSWSDRTRVVTRTLEYYYWRYGSQMVYQLQDRENDVSDYILQEVRLIRVEAGEDMEEIFDEEWNEMTNVFLEDLDGLRHQLLESIEEE